jgi:hypothetical protein
MMRGLFIVMALSCIGHAQAMTVKHADIRHQNGRYYVQFNVLINADKDTVSTLMDDYNSWPQWSSVVRKVIILKQTDTRTSLLKLKLNSCLLFFCKSLDKQQTVTRVAAGHLVTLTTKNNTDFRYAREVWHASAEGNHTRLLYDAVMEPDFFVPPLMGRWIISSRIRQALQQSIAKLEQMAHDSAS